MDPRRVIPSWLWSAVAAILLLAPVLPSGADAASNRPPDVATLHQVAVTEDVTNSLGSWIWAATTTDRQTVQFWRAFEVPRSSMVVHARLLMTADNEYTVYLDGRELGRGAEWRELHDYDVTLLIFPGWHTLAVKAYNDVSLAGMILGMRIDLADKQTILIQSDRTWRIVPAGDKHWQTATEADASWPPATIVGALRGSHWDEMPQNVDLTPILRPTVAYFWQQGWFQILLASVCLAALTVSGRLLAQVAAHRKERWLLQRERARIARDIHDDLGSRMTQLVLHGEVVQSELPADSGTRLQIDRICEEARGVLSTMDEILWAVSPRHDTFSDFTSYVCGYAQEFLKPTHIQCLFDIAPDTAALALDLPVRRALLMAIKESLNNAVKHSEASELIVRVAFLGDRLLLSVADNGKGFDPAQPRNERNGFANMAGRVREVGGSCVVTSRPGHGCRVEFTIPVKRTGSRFWNRLVKPAPGREPALETKLL